MSLLSFRTTVFRDLYDRISANTQKALYAWMTQILQSSYNARGRLDWSISLRQGAMERTSCWPLHAGWSRWISGCLQQSPMRNCRGPARAKTTWHVTKGLMTLAGGGGGQSLRPTRRSQARTSLSGVSTGFCFCFGTSRVKSGSYTSSPLPRAGGCSLHHRPIETFD